MGKVSPLCLSAFSTTVLKTVSRRETLDMLRIGMEGQVIARDGYWVDVAGRVRHGSRAIAGSSFVPLLNPSASTGFKSRHHPTKYQIPPGRFD